MIKTAFRDCCMKCGDVDVDYDCAETVLGEKTVYIFCSHAKVCKKYIDEKECDGVKAIMTAVANGVK